MQPGIGQGTKRVKCAHERYIKQSRVDLYLGHGVVGAGDAVADVHEINGDETGDTDPQQQHQRRDKQLYPRPDTCVGPGCRCPAGIEVGNVRDRQGSSGRTRKRQELARKWLGARPEEAGGTQSCNRGRKYVQQRQGALTTEARGTRATEAESECNRGRGHKCSRGRGNTSNQRRTARGGREHAAYSKVPLHRLCRQTSSSTPPSAAAAMAP